MTHFHSEAFVEMQDAMHAALKSAAATFQREVPDAGEFRLSEGSTVFTFVDSKPLPVTPEGLMDLGCPLLFRFEGVGPDGSILHVEQYGDGSFPEHRAAAPFNLTFAQDPFGPQKHSEPNSSRRCLSADEVKWVLASPWGSCRHFSLYGPDASAMLAEPEVLETARAIGLIQFGAQHEEECFTQARLVLINGHLSVSNGAFSDLECSSAGLTFGHLEARGTSFSCRNGVLSGDCLRLSGANEISLKGARVVVQDVSIEGHTESVEITESVVSDALIQAIKRHLTPGQCAHIMVDRDPFVRLFPDGEVVPGISTFHYQGFSMEPSMLKGVLKAGPEFIDLPVLAAETLLDLKAEWGRLEAVSFKHGRCDPDVKTRLKSAGLRVR